MCFYQAFLVKQLRHQQGGSGLIGANTRTTI